MNPEDVGRILDEVGERIGPAGEYAWTLTVRQVVIDACLWGALGLFLVGLAAFTFLRLRANDRDAYESKTIGVWNCLAIAAWALIPGLALLGMVGTQLLNPEYHAMQRLLVTLLP